MEEGKTEVPNQQESDTSEVLQFPVEKESDMSIEHLAMKNQIEDAKITLAQQELRCKSIHCQFMMEVMEKQKLEARLKMMQAACSDQ